MLRAQLDTERGRTQRGWLGKGPPAAQIWGFTKGLGFMGTPGHLFGSSYNKANSMVFSQRFWVYRDAPFWGVPVMRIVVVWGLYRGLLFWEATYGSFNFYGAQPGFRV